MENKKHHGWICLRIGADGRPEYIEAVAGDGGKDWSYTNELAKAILLSDYWKRRFLADMHKVNARGAQAISKRNDDNASKQETRKWGVFTWSSFNMYPRSVAIKTYVHKTAAEKYARANGLVVRTLLDY